MKKLKKDIGELIGAGVLTGVGASAVSGAGGDASGLTGIAGGMGTLGTITGLGAVVRQTKKLAPKKKKR